MNNLREFKKYVEENANIIDYTTIWRWIRKYKDSLKLAQGENSNVSDNVDKEKNCHANGIDDLNSVNCKYWCSDKCKFYY
jgi:hypothetical protein